MRIAVLIPDRGDRPQFLMNCLRMMAAQTLKPEMICVMNYPAESDKCDITQRYRLGYNYLCGKGIDLIAFIENDDYYCPEYLEYMVKKWEEKGKPDLFGTNYTIYYNLKLKKYFTFRHIQRSSAMSTFIKPDLKFTWPMDHDPYTDSWLWVSSGITNKLSIEPGYIICVGIKHGQGMLGGAFHIDHLHRFINDDDDFLQNNLDAESYKFYSTIDFIKD